MNAVCGFGRTRCCIIKSTPPRVAALALSVAKSTLPLTIRNKFRPRRWIITVTLAARLQTPTMGLKLLLIVRGTILATPIGVEHAAICCQAHNPGVRWRAPCIRLVVRPSLYPVPEECRSGGVEQANGQFTLIDFRRGRYVAKVEGASALVKNEGKDIDKATVSAPYDRTRIEVVSLNGKPFVKRTFALSADGRPMVTTVLNRLTGWSSAQRLIAK